MLCFSYCLCFLEVKMTFVNKMYLCSSPIILVSWFMFHLFFFFFWFKIILLCDQFLILTCCLWKVGLFNENFPWNRETQSHNHTLLTKCCFNVETYKYYLSILHRINFQILLYSYLHENFVCVCVCIWFFFL